MYHFPGFGQKTIHSKSRINVTCQTIVWLICMTVNQIKELAGVTYNPERLDFSAACFMDGYGCGSKQARTSSSSSMSVAIHMHSGIRTSPLEC